MGIEMKRKEVTDTFVMISNGKKTYLGSWPPNYLIEIFTHLNLCPADAIHNSK